MESILRQTFRDFELILVDDGSPDNCGSMCDEWARKDSRIRVIHKKNGGLSDARNTGIENSTGEWISFIDSDDWIAEDMLETLYSIAVQNDADLAICNSVKVDESGNTIEDKPEVPDGVFTADAFWKQYATTRSWRYYVVTWDKLYKRDLFNTLRFPIGLIHEDSYILYDLIRCCKKIAMTDKIGYFYRIRPGSIMSQVENQIDFVDLNVHVHRAEKAIADKNWFVAELSLYRIKGKLINEEFESCKEYKEMKPHLWRIYFKLFMHMPNRTRLSVFLFLADSRLAKKLNRP